MGKLRDAPRHTITIQHTGAETGRNDGDGHGGDDNNNYSNVSAGGMYCVRCIIHTHPIHRSMLAIETCVDPRVRAVGGMRRYGGWWVVTHASSLGFCMQVKVQRAAAAATASTTTPTIFDENHDQSVWQCEVQKCGTARDEGKEKETQKEADGLSPVMGCAI